MFKLIKFNNIYIYIYILKIKREGAAKVLFNGKKFCFQMKDCGLCTNYT